MFEISKVYTIRFKGIEIRKSEILAKTHFISGQTMIYISNYQICYSNVFQSKSYKTKYCIWFRLLVRPGTAGAQNNRVRRNTNSRYKTIWFGGIQTLGTKQKYLGDSNSRLKKYGLEEYQL